MENFVNKGWETTNPIGKISQTIGAIKITVKIIDISNMEAVRDYLVTLLQPNEEVILMNGNMPIGKLVPMNDKQPAKAERVPDLYPTMWVSDDFDDLLPGEYWLTEQT